jgi:hypothetical protein
MQRWVRSSGSLRCRGKSRCVRGVRDNAIDISLIFAKFLSRTHSADLVGTHVAALCRLFARHRGRVH